MQDIFLFNVTETALSTSSPTEVTIPPRIVIASGTSEELYTFATSSVSERKEVTIDARYNGSTLQTTLTILPLGELVVDLGSAPTASVAGQISVLPSNPAPPTPLFSWDAVTGAYRYDLQVKRISDAEEVIRGRVAETQYQVPGTAPLSTGEYRGRVRTQTEYGSVQFHD